MDCKYNRFVSSKIKFLNLIKISFILKSEKSKVLSSVEGHLNCILHTMDLYRKFPAFWSFIFFALGIIASLKSYFFVPFIFVVPAYLLRKTPFVLLFFLILGSVRTLPIKIFLHDLSGIEGKKIDCELHINTMKRGNISTIFIGDKKIRTQLYVFISNAPLLAPGTEIRAEGVLKRKVKRRCHYLPSPYHISDTCFYLLIEDWSYKEPGLKGKMREKLFDFIKRASWNKQNESLLMAFLGGRRYSLSRETKESFKKAGIYHLLALSGLHIGILGVVTELLLTFLRIPRPFSGILATIMLTLYTLTVGIRPSLLRALILAVVLMLSISISRKHISLNALGVAGFVSLLFNPLWIMDLGFQLSYLATFGILLVLPLLQFPKLSKFPRMIGLSLGISASAQIFTSPLISYTFGEIPLLAPIANLFAIPLLMTIFAEFILLLIFSHTFLSLPIKATLNFFLTVFSYLLIWIEELNPPVIHARLKPLTAFLLYLGIGLILFLMRKLFKEISSL